MRVADALWPISQVGEIIELTASRASGRARDPVQALARGHRAFGRWFDVVAQQCGLEAEEVRSSLHDAPEILLRGGPSVVCISMMDDGPTTHALMVRRGQGRRVEVIGPDREPRWLPLDAVLEFLVERLPSSVRQSVDSILDRAQVPRHRRARARMGVLRDHHGHDEIGRLWILRTPVHVGLWRRLREANVHRKLSAFVALHLVDQGRALLAWWTIGTGVLEDRLTVGVLVAWGLLQLTGVPIAFLRGRIVGLIGIDWSLILRTRLMRGASRLSPDAIRNEGSGQLLARVLESGRVEGAVFSAALGGVTALLDIAIAVAVLVNGAGGGIHGALLAIFFALALPTCVAYYRRLSAWTDERLSMTDQLVEGIVGHRTRMVEERPDNWHREEDAYLERYFAATIRFDRAVLLVSGALPRLWLVVGFIGLAPAVIANEASMGLLAASVLGVMMASGALQRWTSGFVAVARAAVAWQRVSELYRVGAQADDETQADVAVAEHELSTSAGHQPAPLVRLRDVSFRYPTRARSVLCGVDFELWAGDRVLLEGPSGQGKSTLGALLMGTRRPTSGLMLLGGLDINTLGDVGWRRQVGGAPQFHDNHVFGDSLEFNLLVGRGYPANPNDASDARRICEELGLGPLLERMPSGLGTTVGEMGWQLSHGERSRLFIARALLQDPTLVVFDESFAALDPENLELALKCVLRRSKTLVVIAHP